MVSGAHHAQAKANRFRVSAVGTPAADLISGMDAAMATLGALFERAGSGKGHQIDIAMVDSMTRFMSPRIVPYLGAGEIPHRSGARDSVSRSSHVANF